MAKTRKLTAENRMPGDPTRQQLVESMIRVDQAGEQAAVQAVRESCKLLEL